MRTKLGTRTQKVGPEWKQSRKKTRTRMGTKWEQEPKSGTAMGTMETRTQKRDKNKNKAEIKTQKQDQNRNKMGTSANKNPTVGREWEQSRNEPKSGTRTANKVGTRTQKWGAKWEQEPKSGTRMGTKWGSRT